jgi:SAP domain-containing ribonucleoprotein
VNNSSYLQDAEKLKARADRFGTSNAAAANAPASSGKKRKSPAPVDPEEEEKRRKRAERFGMPVAVSVFRTFAMDHPTY